MMKGADSLFFGLDIGSMNIRMAALSATHNDDLELLATAQGITRGVRRGIVVNIESLIESLSEVISEMETRLNAEMKEVTVNIGGDHIEGLNSRGVVAIAGKNKEVNKDDIARVIEAAQAVSIPFDQELIHVLPQGYSVDNQKGVRNPEHMIGVRLESAVHLVTASSTAGKSLVQSLNRSGLHVNQVVYGALAASRVVLSQDERDLGVLMVNIGADTTEVLLFQEGEPCVSFVVPMGGRLITRDLSHVLYTPLSDAEELKCHSTICYEPLVDHQESVLVSGVGSRPPRSCDPREICQIAQARMTEILRALKRRLDRMHISLASLNGIVLTGGGGLLLGLPELVESIFNTPTRMGIPRNFEGDFHLYRNPAWSTVVGLALFSADLHSQSPVVRGKRTVLKNIKEWLRNFFF